MDPRPAQRGGRGVTITRMASSATGRAGIAAVRAMLAERGDGPDTPIVERRQRMEAFAADSPEVPGITIEEGLLGLRQRLSAVPPRSRGNVLFLHGGAYVLGSARTHIKLAARYAGYGKAVRGRLDSAGGQ